MLEPVLVSEDLESRQESKPKVLVPIRERESYLLWRRPKFDAFRAMTVSVRCDYQS